MPLLRVVASIMFCLAMLAPSLARAEAAKKFAVLPFTINGPEKYHYLSKGVPDMLSTRLYWEGHFQGIGADKIAAAVAGKSVTDASAQTRLDALIPALENVAQSINAQLFKRPDEAPQQKQVVNAMNPDLVHNEDKAGKEFYLNPQFRYAGDAGESGRLRSQTLPYVARSMIVGDCDGDGKNEVLLADDHTLYAYHYTENGGLEPAGEYELGLLMMVLRLSLVDINGDGNNDVVVSMVDRDTFPQSAILSYSNGKFTLLADRIHFHLAAVQAPPDYRKVLVGQAKGGNTFFASGVHEIVKMGGEYRAGNPMLLPPEANAYNFVYLPVPDDDYKVVLTDRTDYLRVYTKTGDRQYTTEKVYSGSSIGLEDTSNLAGIKDPLVSKPMFYVPIRLLAFRLGDDKNYQILANHPISVAAQFFTRYRYFPAGEINALSWDGVGLNLVWKTRRIKGGVSDYCIADINNDGVTDLNVCMNTHPGMIGAKFRRTVLLSYPLDTSKGQAGVSEEFKEE